MPEVNGKTAYFLGAGASNASKFELPCMKSFFREEDFKSDEYGNLLNFIKSRFAGVSFSELNLEEVITFLELSLDSFGSFGERPQPSILEARNQFDKYVSYRLAVPLLKGCDLHKKVISSELAGMESKDSIISLNYDLIVDNTLYELLPRNDIGSPQHECLLHRMYALLGKTQLIHGERPSLYHRDAQLGFYLKLHGSIDWLYCPNQSCGNHQLFFPNWLGSNSVHNKPGDLCSLCGSPLVNVIVPPTMHKSFEKFPKLGLLWSLAYRELNQADQIVVLGVSFAASDYYLSWLFKKAVVERAREPSIFVIDIDGSVPKRVKEITGIAPIHHRSLDEFLEQRQKRANI